MRKLLLLTLFIPFLAKAEFLSIEDAWVRDAPPNARVMVAYASIRNISEYPIWITGASSSYFKAVELHETIEENGMASMIQLDFVKLAPAESVSFEPGGKHFMLFTPLGRSTLGDEIEFKLHLGNGDKESFNAIVSRNQP